MVRQAPKGFLPSKSWTESSTNALNRIEVSYLLTRIIHSFSSSTSSLPTLTSALVSLVETMPAMLLSWTCPPTTAQDRRSLSSLTFTCFRVVSVAYVLPSVERDANFFPSSISPGLINPNCTNFIGNGVVLHVPGFFDELDALVKKGKSRLNRICSD